MPSQPVFLPAEDSAKIPCGKFEFPLWWYIAIPLIFIVALAAAYLVDRREPGPYVTAGIAIAILIPAMLFAIRIWAWFGPLEVDMDRSGIRLLTRTKHVFTAWPDVRSIAWPHVGPGRNALLLKLRDGSTKKFALPHLSGEARGRLTEILGKLAKANGIEMAV